MPPIVLADASIWAPSVPALLLTHIVYTIVAVVIAAVVALPIGVAIGVTGKGEGIVAGIANAARAIPSLGLLIFLGLLLAAPLPASGYLIAMYVVLVVLAIPSIMTNAFAGIQSVDPDAVDAARGMGFTEMQILTRVQLPCALPLILSGLRSATLQVIATATIAAALPLGGLGQLIMGGLAQRDAEQMIAGALIVTGLALVSEVLFILAARLVVSPGLRACGRASKRRRTALRAQMENA